MLVLSRKKGESIVISDNIEITVIEIIGDTIRLGIQAPKEVTVHRKEIYLAIQESNKEAASKSKDSSLIGELDEFMLKYRKKK